MSHVPDLLRAYASINSMDKHMPINLYIGRSDKPRTFAVSDFVLSRPDDSTWRIHIPNKLDVVWTSTDVKNVTFMNNKFAFHSADYTPGNLRLGIISNG